MIWKIILAIWLMGAVVADLRTYKIPNWFCACMAVNGYGIQIILFRMKGVMDSTYGMLIAFLILFGFFALGVLGAGDVKLVCAVGTFAGHGIWRMLLYICAISGLAAVGKLLLRAGSWRWNKTVVADGTNRNYTRMHMSIPILLAGLLYMTGG